MLPSGSLNQATDTSPNRAIPRSSVFKGSPYCSKVTPFAVSSSTVASTSSTDQLAIVAPEVPAFPGDG